MATAPKRKLQPLNSIKRRRSKRIKNSCTAANTQKSHRNVTNDFHLEALRQLLCHNISFDRPYNLLNLEYVLYDEYLRNPAAFQPRETFPAGAIGAAIAASLGTKKQSLRGQMQTQIKESKHCSEVLLDTFTKSPESTEGLWTEETEAGQEELVFQYYSGKQSSFSFTETADPDQVLFPGLGSEKILGLELISINQNFPPRLGYFQKDRDGYEVLPSIEISTTEKIEEIEEGGVNAMNEGIEEIEVHKVNHEESLKTYDWEYHDVALDCIRRYIEEERGKEWG